MKNKKLLLGLLVLVLLVVGAAYYFGSDELQGRFGTSDTRTDCDYGSDTSVANIRECMEDFIVDEYSPVEDENFNLIYNRLGEIQTQLDDIESKIDSL